jgi:hypothetical protein
MAQTALFRWQQILTCRTTVDSSESLRVAKVNKCDMPPRVSDHQATEQAARMVERYHSLFLRTLQVLQDLRRQGSTVVVRRAGQVNIGQHQVNVAGGNER